MAIKIAPAELGGEELETAEPEEEIIAPATPDSAAKGNLVDVNSLSAEQLQYLLEQRRSQEAEAAKAEAKAVTPPAKAPQGMVWVFNRTPTTFLWQYDGLVYEIDGHAMILLPERIAKHGRKRSLISLDVVENSAVFKLALEGEPKFGIPLKVVNRMELLDRTHDNNPLGAALTVPTRLAAIKVAGAAEAMQRRSDQYVELE